MRRDSLFYRIFQQYPELLFDLLGESPPNANAYRFDSVAVKEPKFEIDGVFLPPDGEAPGTVYFCEVQFQKDEQLYERLFGESFLYFYRQRQRFSDWQAIVIYPSRATEQSAVHPYRALLNSDQVHRVYLNELGDPQALPLSMGLMVLTTASRSQAPAQARGLVSRAQQEVSDPRDQQAIISLVTTIMMYQFSRMSRQEVEAMLAMSIEESRAYQEIKAEGLEVGRQEGRQEGLASEQALILRQLKRKVGDLTEVSRSKVQALSFAQLEELGETLLDFEAVADLEDWFSRLEVALAETIHRLSQQFGTLDESVMQAAGLLSLEQLAQLTTPETMPSDVDALKQWLTEQTGNPLLFEETV
ncbi:MAG: Rpn family recombination-promoting nuclease/putative transposase [Cyanobacteria bacterium P01_A01_bin.105]